MDLKQHIGIVPDFPKPGIMFLDIMPLLAEPDALGHCVDAMVERWSGKVDCIVGLESRGFMFAAPMAYAMGCGFVPARKKGKLPKPVISVTYELEYGTDTIELKAGIIESGARVLVVDDLLATGGTAAAACKLVEKCDAHVIGCAFVIELSGLRGREKLPDVPIQSLITY